MLNVVDVGFARDRTMKHFATIALVLGVLSVGAANRTSAQNQGPQFQDLFNGRDLTGWVNINTADDTWNIRDGMLICSGCPIGVMCSEKQTELRPPHRMDAHGGRRQLRRLRVERRPAR